MTMIFKNSIIPIFLNYLLTSTSASFKLVLFSKVFVTIYCFKSLVYIIIRLHFLQINNLKGDIKIARLNSILVLYFAFLSRKNELNSTISCK